MVNNDVNDIYGAYVTNLSMYVGQYDFSEVGCFIDEYPDYLCLYSEVKNYQKTSLTCVCFYEHDRKFDGMHGLYNAIIYKDKKLLEKYKKRFNGMKWFIAPDYSMYGAMPKYLQIMNIAKARTVSIWLTNELNCSVIPNITFSNEESLDFCFDGIMHGSVVAISLKGSIRSIEDRNFTEKVIPLMIERIKPKAIVVYSVACDSKTKKVLKFAYEKGIKVVIPSNLLKERNYLKKGCHFGT